MSDKSAPAEIDVTPEMIEAGARELFLQLGPYEKDVPPYSEVAEAVFRIMLAQYFATPGSRKSEQ